ncbi:MAG: ATPase, partial [Gammaproteobacteria bacterium]
VFGSVFASEHIIAPLWLHPIEQPIPVLAASLIFGVFVVTSGLCLDALQFHWRGQASEFWGARFGLSLTYFGLLAAFWNAGGLWLAMLGTLWFIVGAGLTGQQRGGAAMGEAAIEYAELVLQVAVNTISFVRVGAFALAHAGLSAAVIGMADGFDSLVGRLAVLVFGNALIIGLEGLVVGIQTTRLVLFEFFIRFLRSSGRRFRPLPSPDEPAGAEETSKKHQRRSS